MCLAAVQSLEVVLSQPPEPDRRNPGLVPLHGFGPGFRLRVKQPRVTPPVDDLAIHLIVELPDDLVRIVRKYRCCHTDILVKGVSSIYYLFFDKNQYR
jgi:hypothetical protein